MQKIELNEWIYNNIKNYINKKIIKQKYNAILIDYNENDKLISICDGKYIINALLNNNLIEYINNNIKYLSDDFTNYPIVTITLNTFNIFPVSDFKSINNEYTNYNNVLILLIDNLIFTDNINSLDLSAENIMNLNEVLNYVNKSNKILQTQYFNIDIISNHKLTMNYVNELSLCNINESKNESKKRLSINSFYNSYMNKMAKLRDD